MVPIRRTIPPVGEITEKTEEDFRSNRRPMNSSARRPASDPDLGSLRAEMVATSRFCPFSPLNSMECCVDVAPAALNGHLAQTCLMSANDPGCVNTLKIESFSHFIASRSFGIEFAGAVDGWSFLDDQLLHRRACLGAHPTLRHWLPRARRRGLTSACTCRSDEEASASNCTGDVRSRSCAVSRFP